jgi:UDP-N-acetylmuramate dehydrogenase
VVQQSELALKQSVSLASFTSYRVGGLADWFALPKTVEAIADSLAWAKQHELPITFLGAGL